MKTIQLALAITLIIGMMSCQKESDLFKKLSPEDEIASEGMEEAYEIAKTYNDSLIWCTDTSNNCNLTLINHFDSLFHHHNDLYETHHNDYSHNNLDDDHHHSAMSQHHHGNNEHGEEGEEEHHGHNQESHNEMIELENDHKSYHPN